MDADSQYFTSYRTKLESDLLRLMDEFALLVIKIQDVRILADQSGQSGTSGQFWKQKLKPMFRKSISSIYKQPISPGGILMCDNIDYKEDKEIRELIDSFHNVIKSRDQYQVAKGNWNEFVNKNPDLSENDKRNSIEKIVFDESAMVYLKNLSNLQGRITYKSHEIIMELNKFVCRNSTYNISEQSDMFGDISQSLPEKSVEDGEQSSTEQKGIAGKPYKTDENVKEPLEVKFSGYGFQYRNYSPILSYIEIFSNNSMMIQDVKKPLNKKSVNIDTTNKNISWKSNLVIEIHDKHTDDKGNDIINKILIRWASYSDKRSFENYLNKVFVKTEKKITRSEFKKRSTLLPEIQQESPPRQRTTDYVVGTTGKARPPSFIPQDNRLTFFQSAASPKKPETILKESVEGEISVPKKIEEGVLKPSERITVIKTMESTEIEHDEKLEAKNTLRNHEYEKLPGQAAKTEESKIIHDESNDDEKSYSMIIDEKEKDLIISKEGSIPLDSNIKNLDANLTDQRIKKSILEKDKIIDISLKTEVTIKNSINEENGEAMIGEGPISDFLIKQELENKQNKTFMDEDEIVDQKNNCTKSLYYDSINMPSTSKPLQMSSKFFQSRSQLKPLTVEQKFLSKALATKTSDEIHQMLLNLFDTLTKDIENFTKIQDQPRSMNNVKFLRLIKQNFENVEKGKTAYKCLCRLLSKSDQILEAITEQYIISNDINMSLEYNILDEYDKECVEKIISILKILKLNLSQIPDTHWWPVANLLSLIFPKPREKLDKTNDSDFKIWIEIISKLCPDLLKTKLIEQDKEIPKEAKVTQKDIKSQREKPDMPSLQPSTPAKKLSISDRMKPFNQSDKSIDTPPKPITTSSKTSLTKLIAHYEKSPTSENQKNKSEHAKITADSISWPIESGQERKPKGLATKPSIVLVKSNYQTEYEQYLAAQKHAEETETIDQKLDIKSVTHSIFEKDAPPDIKVRTTKVAESSPASVEKSVSIPEQEPKKTEDTASVHVTFAEDVVVLEKKSIEISDALSKDISLGKQSDESADVQPLHSSVDNKSKDAKESKQSVFSAFKVFTGMEKKSKDAKESKPQKISIEKAATDSENIRTEFKDLKLPERDMMGAITKTRPRAPGKLTKNTVKSDVVDIFADSSSITSHSPTKTSIPKDSHTSISNPKIEDNEKSDVVEKLEKKSLMSIKMLPMNTEILAHKFKHTSGDPTPKSESIIQQPEKANKSIFGFKKPKEQNKIVETTEHISKVGSKPLAGSKSQASVASQLNLRRKQILELEDDTSSSSINSPHTSDPTVVKDTEESKKSRLSIGSKPGIGSLFSRKASNNAENDNLETPATDIGNKDVKTAHEIEKSESHNTEQPVKKNKVSDLASRFFKNT